MGNLNASVKADSDIFPERIDIFPEEKLSTYPGTVEDMLKKCKEIFPINFEGAKLTFQKAFSNHLQISQSLNLSSLSGAGCRISATYVGNDQIGPNEIYPVFVGEIDPSANFSGRMFLRPYERLIARVDAQVQQGSFGTNATLDYRGDDFSASLTVVQPNPINCTGVLVGHYLQKFYKNVDLGAEIIYQKSPHIPGGQAAFTSLCGKYTGENGIFSVFMGPHKFYLSYYHRASQQVQFGSEFETDFMSNSSVATLGYLIDIPKANLVYKGMIDSNWNVGGTLEKSLSPAPFSLSISGTLNQMKDQFRLGIGFTVGS